ncbi:MAG TPA: hypothetical protein VHE35_28920 [Kofleriaceae bacterium]|nr:hypothetical protein [Kofleriaceae bacterium]
MRRPPSSLALVLTYLALVALALLSWFAASAGGGPALALAIAAAKVALIALVFMELVAAHAVDRIIAVLAVFFVALLCFGLLADVSLR